MLCNVTCTHTKTTQCHKLLILDKDAEMDNQCATKIILNRSRDSQADIDKAISGKTTTKNCWKACPRVYTFRLLYIYYAAI